MKRFGDKVVFIFQNSKQQMFGSDEFTVKDLCFKVGDF